VIIKDEYPPNFELIRSAFPNAENHGVIFAYDGRVYNPSGNTIPPALLAHEGVHLRRQAEGTADTWWHSYIRDSEFRYHEELLAHAAEFKASRSHGDRNAGAALLQRTAMRLIAPLYNYNPPRTLQQALKDLREEIAK
jgi:hypothetical protein